MTDRAAYKGKITNTVTKGDKLIYNIKVPGVNFEHEDMTDEELADLSGEVKTYQLED